MFTFTDALIIAAECHRNDRDDCGVEYIKHPLHLAHLLKIRGCSNECQITALLHDVLEDDKSGVYTEDFLIQKHVPESIIIALKCLTHHKDTEFIAEYKAKLIEQGYESSFALILAKEEEYFAYIRKLARNDIAREVKMADLEHNSDIRRIKQSDLENFKQRAYIGRRTMKYAIALNMLRGGRVG
jgi:(p)ppGpp synthase/HD superfamily hydrolase